MNCKRDVNCGLRMKKSNYCWHDSDDIYLHTRAKQSNNTEQVVSSWRPPPQRTGHWPHSPDRNPEDLCRENKNCELLFTSIDELVLIAWMMVKTEERCYAELWKCISVHCTRGPLTTALYGAATGAGARPALLLSSHRSTTDCSALPVSGDL